MSEETKRRNLELCVIPLYGTHLIEASAGTGKTYTITSLVVRLLVERGLSIDQVLAVTFTNAATSELKERIVARVVELRDAVKACRMKRVEGAASGDPLIEHIVSLPNQERVEKRLSVAARDADRASVFTIHSFAGRMLKDHSFESGAREGAELNGDQRILVRDVVSDFWSSRVAVLPRDLLAQVGGSAFFGVLSKVGRIAAGAFGVQPVPLAEPLDLESVRGELIDRFREARSLFLTEGEALRAILLGSESLNRNKMRIASLEGDYQNYCIYFEQEQPTVAHPATDRFTQEKVNSSVKKKRVAPAHPLLVVLGELREAALRVELAVEQFADGLRAELCACLLKKVSAEHRRAGTQGFEGLLSDLVSALRDPERGEKLAAEIRKATPVALVDEFQDTDPTQYEIFSRIYGSQDSIDSALYLIGDPKQSIYAFRGADIQTYLAAARGAAGGVWTLSTSYRASPSLVRAQNALFEKTSRPFGTPQIVYPQVSHRTGAVDELLDAEGHALPGMRIIDCPPKADWLAFTAREVGRFLASSPTLEGRPVTPGDIAVLTRTNQQAASIQDSLRSLQIPAVMHGDRSVFESSEAVELRRLLRALEDPSHRSTVRTALSTRTLGLRAEQLLELDSRAEKLEEWMGRLKAWGELWRRRGVAHAMSALHRDVDFIAVAVRIIDGERRVTNFRHLLELLHEAEKSEHLGVAGLLRWLDAAIFDPSTQGMASEGMQLRLESDADAVTLTTGHKSKGLEYNIVFLPSVGKADKKWNEEAFRYYDEDFQQTRLEMRGKSTREGSDEVHTSEMRQESLRLAYVALTRAKHHVVALCGASKGFSPMSYLLHESGSAAPGGIDSLVLRLGKLKEGGRLSDLEELAEQSRGAIEVAPFLDEAVGSFELRDVRVEISAPRELPELAERERTSSFSAMTRGSHRKLSRSEREGRDLDERAELPTTMGLDSSMDPEEVSSRRGEPSLSVLAEFPRGARPGDALHAAFEHSPFQESEGATRSEVVQRELSKRGFAQADIDAARQNVEDVLAVSMNDTRDPSAGRASCFTLASLAPAQLAPEMEFSFPVGSPEKRLSAARLARALGHIEKHPHAPVIARDVANSVDGVRDEFLSQEYLGLVSELPFTAWSGFLRGFIDLVFEHEGKLYGLDYKSNYLGPHYEDYGRAALRAAMEEHHYFIQALLYAVAIHRYGRSRIADYSYERHFGGMRYLFLRGMHPEHGSSGVLSFRPSEELLNSLEEALDVES